MKVIRVLLWVVLIPVAFVGLFVVLVLYSVIPRQYTTTDLADYGSYIGNNNDHFPQEFITSFFPAQIEEDFSDVRYSYRAQKNDEYAFEAYLEFSIEDKSTYDRFVSEKTGSLEGTCFQYDPSFVEYTVDNVLVLDSFSGGAYHIRYAKIGKILCCESEQKIIFVALGVRDGGVVTTDFLCVYFERFHIDPIDHETGYDSL